MANPSKYTLFSGAGAGAEAFFGHIAETYGVQEVNFSFDGHKTSRERGIRTLTPEELARKDVSLSYVSRLLNRKFTNAPFMRKVLQTIMHQVDSGMEVFVVGTIQPDGTVKGGTGWGAEFAKICNKPLHVFSQGDDKWFLWNHDQGAWKTTMTPRIAHPHFTGTGTRFLEENGKQAIRDLFAKTFK